MRHVLVSLRGRVRCAALPRRTAGTRLLSTRMQSPPDFTNYEVAFRSKTTSELLRGYLVLASCRPFIVANADKILFVLNRTLGQGFTNTVIRHTFFRHFCAGETEAEARAVTAHLTQYGVNGILDFAAEGDVLTENLQEKSNALSRSYSYESEKVCDLRAEEFMQCVHVASKGGFAAIKVTALGDPNVIEKFSTCIVSAQRLFQRFTESADLKQLSKREFIEKYDGIFDGNEGSELFDSIYFSTKNRLNVGEGDKEPVIDFHHWMVYMEPKRFNSLLSKSKTKLSNVALLTNLEIDLLENIYARLSKVASAAKRQGAMLTIDAEQTYFQPAIDLWTLSLQRFHNDYNKEPTVFATYQAYLKDSYKRLDFGLELAEREKWSFACKLVRGAYMLQERKLAEKQGQESPVWKTIDETAASYLKCAARVLQTKSSKIVVASHNTQSIQDILQMEHEDGQICFAQLLGMADHVTFVLAHLGFKVYKYLPFGPVEYVVPYLLRRVQENSILSKNGLLSKRALLYEIRRRFFGF